MVLKIMKATSSGGSHSRIFEVAHIIPHSLTQNLTQAASLVGRPVKNIVLFPF